MRQQMPDFLPDDFYDWPEQKRQEWLEGVADKVEQETVAKPISEQEQADLNDKFVRTSLRLKNKQEEYDEVKKRWNEEVIKPLKEERSELLEKIETGEEKIETRVSYIADQDEDRMYIFAPDGTLIESRRLYAEERQQTVQGHMRKVQDNDNS